MSPEDRLKILERLSTALIDDFQRDFHDVLAEAYSVTSRTPEQANNEIRNALIHCARVCAATTVEEAEKNIAEARWHIDLAKRDCFKICILKTREDIERILDISEYRYKAIRGTDRQRLKRINGQMKGLLRKESAPATRHDAMTSEFETLYDEVSDFEEHVKITYPVTWTSRAIWYRIWIKINNYANKLGGWVIAVLVLALLASPIMPPPAKAYYNQVMKFLFCKVSSDVSCK